MTRRDAIVAVTAVLTPPAVSLAGAQVPPGVLTVDLSQWKAIRVKHGQREYYLDPADVFEALKD